MTWERFVGKIHCLLYGHLFGEWVELDQRISSPREFMRQCTSCLMLQYGKRTLTNDIRPTKVGSC